MYCCRFKLSCLIAMMNHNQLMFESLNNSALWRGVWGAGVGTGRVSPSHASISHFSLHNGPLFKPKLVTIHHGDEAGHNLWLQLYVDVREICNSNKYPERDLVALQTAYGILIINSFLPLMLFADLFLGYACGHGQCCSSLLCSAFLSTIFFPPITIFIWLQFILIVWVLCFNLK